MNQNQKFKVKEFEWFQMQTRVRQMVQQIITPIQKRILQHSTNMAKFKQTQQTDSLKVQQLTLMVTGDPKIFQIGIFKEVDKRFEVHQKSFEQMRRLIQESNQFVDKKFDLLDLRMKQTNDLMLNFVSLKERVNTEIEIQNENIQKVRANLQKMIQKVNQDISQTNQRIVDNLMLCQKTDKSLQQRIRANEMSIQINKDAIERNKAGIMEKNIQLETHEFKLDKLFQKLKQIDRGHNIHNKMQQYMKDMEIAIRKCEFRVQAVTPLVTMAQLQQALEYILPQKLRKRIIIFGYKKYNKLNREILQKNYDQVSEKFNGMQVVQSMQKKNMREVTSLKRKKIISMGIDIDHLTFQARQRYYQQVDMDQLSQQQEDNQNKAKIDEAEILNLVSLYFNEFTTDVSQKVKNQLQDTKAYLYGMQSELKKEMQMNYNKAKKSQQHCLQFHRDQMLQMKSVINQLQEVDESRKSLENWLVRGQQIEKKFYNFCSLINHLQIQQEIDKQNISLMGLQENRATLEKGGSGLGGISNNGVSIGNALHGQQQKNSIIELNDKCFSCCGYPASVLSSFKMACLAYHPSGIVIDGKEYKREDVLEFTTNLLQTIKGSLQLGSNNMSNNNNMNNMNNNINNNNNSYGQSIAMQSILSQQNSNNIIYQNTDRTDIRYYNNYNNNYNNNNSNNNNYNMNRTSYVTHSRVTNRQKINSNSNNGLDTLQRLGNNSRLQYLVGNSNNNNNNYIDSYHVSNNNINNNNKASQYTTTINDINHITDINSTKQTITKPQQQQQSPSIIINQYNQTLSIDPQVRLKSSSMRMRKSVKKNPLSIDQRKSTHHKSRSTHNHTALSYATVNNSHNQSGGGHNSNINGHNNNNSMSKQMLTVTNNFMQLKKKHLNYLT